MCGCEAHWRDDVFCTCQCPEHLQLRQSKVYHEALDKAAFDLGLTVYSLTNVQKDTLINAILNAHKAMNQE